MKQGKQPPRHKAFGQSIPQTLPARLSRSVFPSASSSLHQEVCITRLGFVETVQPQFISGQGTKAEMRLNPEWQAQRERCRAMVADSGTAAANMSGTAFGTVAKT